MSPHGSIAKGKGLEEGKLELWVWKGMAWEAPDKARCWGLERCWHSLAWSIDWIAVQEPETSRGVADGSAPRLSCLGSGGF